MFPDIKPHIELYTAMPWHPHTGGIAQCLEIPLFIWPPSDATDCGT